MELSKVHAHTTHDTQDTSHNTTHLRENTREEEIKKERTRGREQERTIKGWTERDGGRTKEKQSEDKMKG